MGASRATERYFDYKAVLVQIVIEALGEIGGPAAIHALKNIAGPTDYNGYKQVYPVLLRLMCAEAASSPPAEAVFTGDFDTAVKYGHKAVAPLCSRLEIEPLTGRVNEPFPRGEIILALAAIRDVSAVDCLLRNFNYEQERHSVSREYGVVFRTIPDVRFVKAILKGMSKYSITALTDAVRLVLPQLPDDVLQTCATLTVKEPSHPTGGGDWSYRTLDCSQLHEMAESEISRRRG